MMDQTGVDFLTIETLDAPDRISALAAELKCRQSVEPLPVAKVVELCAAWSSEVIKPPASLVAGAVFLSMWMRKGTLGALLARELGADWQLGWIVEGRNRFKVFPLGLVGHWPAANVPILPVLSGLCALLGGNVALVRVPPSFRKPVQALLDALRRVPGGEVLGRYLRFVSFASDRLDLQQALAQAVDGAMIWGGKDAVHAIRALPFPHWARFMVFGPRISVAALDRGAWVDPAARERWCRRLARDVWQFDQMACSSPQVLFVEKGDADDLGILVARLEAAFREENRAHPREQVDPAVTSAIVRARAEVFLSGAAAGAVFPQAPDWTILLYKTQCFPEPVQGKTLHVVPVDDLRSIVAQLDGNVQTLGLGMSSEVLEAELAEAAGQRGVDRIVRLGSMHVFDSPWDGYRLVAPMVRTVRHAPSASFDARSA